MKCARMLTLIAIASGLIGCGGGGGGSSSSSTHYVGTYTRSDAPSGTGEFTLVSGGRLTASLIESGTGKTGVLAGRIIKGDITGSINMHDSAIVGFTGTVEPGVNGGIIIHAKLAGSSDNVTFNLTRG